MAGNETLIENALSALEPGFGAVDLSSRTFPFTHSDYYRNEMGEGLLKRFCSFHRLVDPAELVNLKLRAIAHERQSLVEGTLNRTVNVDPGYLDKTKLVLTTTKNAYHRIYLGSGVYGDVELVYRSGGFTCLEWTFSDYKDGLAAEFFWQVRERYLEQLRSESV
jgi:hypothetical protein